MSQRTKLGLELVEPVHGFPSPLRSLGAANPSNGNPARAFEPDGLRIFQLNGAAAGQTVFHYHMHLLPKFAGEEDRLLKRVMAGEGELEAAATAIQAALASL